jgi:tryptophan synthase alpha chain
MTGAPGKPEPGEAVPRPDQAAAQGPIPSPHPPMGMSTIRGASALERVDSVPEANGAKTLAVYLMAGPDTPELAEAVVEGGANLVELGFPFSDPLADGPVIRRAAERALAQGMRTRACLECLAAVRERVEVPLVPMTYASLLEAYGYERFAADAEAAGATSLIVADLPAGERPGLRRVQLVAPTSTDERIALAAADSDGWLYLVTVTGTTGAREQLSPGLARLVGRARQLTDLPLYAGFGIGTPEQASAAAELADGVVVGSRAVEVAEHGPNALRDYVRSLRVAIDANVGIIGGR